MYNVVFAGDYKQSLVWERVSRSIVRSTLGLGAAKQPNLNNGFGAEDALASLAE